MVETVFARTLGVPEHNVRIVAPDVGGSFGLKIHAGTKLHTAAAIKLGRPVKLVADRLESFVSDIHARENRVKAKIGIMNDGTMIAAEIDDLSGASAYSQYPRTSVFRITRSSISPSVPTNIRITAQRRRSCTLTRYRHRSTGRSAIRSEFRSANT